MPQINGLASPSVGAAGGGCSSCRSGACASCKNCPSCASNRDGAASILKQLKQMLSQDRTGTQNGINDAFKGDKNLASNPVLMKILGVLGVAPQG